MRLNRWVYATASAAMVVSGALAEQACSSSDNYCTGSGASEVCYLYTVPSGSDASTTVVHEASTGPVDTGSPDSAANNATDAAPAPFGPGTGTACLGAIGSYPAASCDPSDEMACGTSLASGCTVAAVCGNPNTCEPFVTNPNPDKGVDNFRMRLINITAPVSLANETVQLAVVTTAVDLPAYVDAGGAACGENGTGLFNWLLSVDKTKGTITTGGAPPSADPFTTGYCFINGMVNGTMIGPSTVAAKFTGNTFSTTPTASTLNIPIFLPGTMLKEVVILPIEQASFNDVTISEDGNCIGSVNNNSIVPSSAGPCTDPLPLGQESCSRWHSAGTLGGYIELEKADGVVVAALGGESLCVLLTNDRDTENPPKCTAAGKTAGNYCSKTNSATGCTDSVWLSAQFAASAVNLQSSDAGVPVCHGGSIGSGS